MSEIFPVPNPKPIVFVKQLNISRYCKYRANLQQPEKYGKGHFVGYSYTVGRYIAATDVIKS